MLAPKLPEAEKALDATPEPVKVYLAEDGEKPLALVLPPFDDIAEIEGLKHLKFSLQEHVATRDYLQGSFESDFQSLGEKYSKYSSSPVYLNRLSELAGLVGNETAETEYLSEALKKSGDVFYIHRFGSNLLYHGADEDAERLFAQLDLSTDVSANLKLAYFSVQRRDFARAKAFVDAALDIDNLDFSSRLFNGALDLICQRYESAVYNFRIALDERPASTVAYCNMAIAYIGLKDHGKAMSSLKRSVALDPLNINAIMVLADLSFAMHRDEDAIPSLRYFTQFEQKNAGAWSRLARACLRIGRPEESILALKHQASISEIGPTWNNLGVAYSVLKDNRKALESFARAMRMEEKRKSREYYLAAKNAANVYGLAERFDILLNFTTSVLETDSSGKIQRDRQLSDLVALHFHALVKLGHARSAVEFARHYLESDGIVDELAVWLVSSLVSVQALRGGVEEIDVLMNLYEKKADALKGKEGDRRERYFNNVAFALAEMGRVADAERAISKINNLLHKSAYPTATLGLIQFRKGRIERATELYEEAVRLAGPVRDRLRIRQKLNLELGKYWLATSRMKGIRLLARVVKESGGENALSKQAREIIKDSKFKKLE